LFNDFLGGLLDLKGTKDLSFFVKLPAKGYRRKQVEVGDQIILICKQQRTVAKWMGISPARSTKWTKKIQDT
jgi:hypothetical protein